jgi:hypothetical protein
MVRELDVFLVCGLQPDVGHQGEQNLRSRLSHHVRVIIPASTLEVESVDVLGLGRLSRNRKKSTSKVWRIRFELCFDAVNGLNLNFRLFLLQLKRNFLLLRRRPVPAL